MWCRNIIVNNLYHLFQGSQLVARTPRSRRPRIQISGHCSSGRRIPSKLRNEGSKRVSMTWRLISARPYPRECAELHSVLLVQVALCGGVRAEQPRGRAGGVTPSASLIGQGPGCVALSASLIGQGPECVAPSESLISQVPECVASSASIIGQGPECVASSESLIGQRPGGVGESCSPRHTVSSRGVRDCLVPGFRA